MIIIVITYLLTRKVSIHLQILLTNICQHNFNYIKQTVSILYIIYVEEYWWKKRGREGTLFCVGEFSGSTEPNHMEV